MSDVDVVIPTRDRPRFLGALLEDLAVQVRPARRVIVVDDSVRPYPWEAKFPNLPLRVIRPARRQFISNAKNTGLTEGTSELVAFVDDDNRIPPDLLKRLGDDLDQEPRWGAVMPGVVYRRRPDLVWVYAAPFRDGRWTFDLIGRNRPRDLAWERRPLPTDALPNLSMVRREVLSRVGAFDPALPVNSSADLCQRIKRAGWEVWADPRVLTEHDVEPPDVPGFWAEHTLDDPDRLRSEVEDWLRFHRRWNEPRRLFAVRAGYHAFGFLVPHFVALASRAPRRIVPHAAASISGFHDGLGPNGLSRPR